MILKLGIWKKHPRSFEIFQPLRDSLAQRLLRASTQRKTQPEASYWPSGGITGDEVEEIMKELKWQTEDSKKKGYISEKHIQLNVWLHQIHESPLGTRDRKVEQQFMWLGENWEKNMKPLWSGLLGDPGKTLNFTGQISGIALHDPTESLRSSFLHFWSRQIPPQLLCVEYQSVRRAIGGISLW